MKTCEKLTQIVLTFMNHSLIKITKDPVLSLFSLSSIIERNFLLVLLVKENVLYSHYFICHKPSLPKTS